MFDYGSYYPTVLPLKNPEQPENDEEDFATSAVPRDLFAIEVFHLENYDDAAAIGGCSIALLAFVSTVANLLPASMLVRILPLKYFSLELANENSHAIASPQSQDSILHRQMCLLSPKQQGLAILCASEVILIVS